MKKVAALEISGHRKISQLHCPLYDMDPLPPKMPQTTPEQDAQCLGVLRYGVLSYAMEVWQKWPKKSD